MSPSTQLLLTKAVNSLFSNPWIIKPQVYLQGANNKTYTKSNATAYSTTPTTPPNRAQNNPTTTDPRKAILQTDNYSTCYQYSCSSDYG
ncbi:hypothetical protein I79_024776 [Cricetulus griseus]|uniref:Uncharacterized protein n=1 Tax=Cricetulus griseus TaxID=10029 RepID=G3ILK8_CRIGR|nr:hypothetical protein I79_024776 [Cricetulus griseus]